MMRLARAIPFVAALLWSLPALAQPTGVTVYTDTEQLSGQGRYQMVSPDHPMPTYNVPSPSAGGLTPVVSAALEGSHVFDTNAGGNLYSAYASNLTGGTTGFLMIFNATSAPGDGSVTPLVCTPFDSTGKAQAYYGSGPPAAFSVGITAVVSSGADCFHKTTGVLTAFFSGMFK